MPWNRLGAGRVQIEFGRHEDDAAVPEDDALRGADDLDDADDFEDAHEDQTTTARGGRQ